MLRQVTTPTNTQSEITIYSKQLGKGNFGTVYTGIATATNEELAVKLIYPPNDHQKQYCEDEIRIMTLLTGPKDKNIIQLYGYGYDYQNNEYTIAMTYAANGSLFDWLEGNKPLTLLQQINMMRDIANGLAYMHEEIDPPIIHSDLKTENILLNKYMEPIICDFGLSKQKNASSSPTRIYGSRLYFSPELILAFFSNSFTPNNEKSDMYAFGLICWCIISQTAKPFDQINNFDYLYNWVVIKNKREILPPEPQCPQKIAETITRLWDRYPHNRPTGSQTRKSIDEIDKSNLNVSFAKKSASPTNCTDMICENDRSKDNIRNEFDKIYLNQDKWNSDASTIFLEETLTKLHQNKKIFEEKSQELAEYIKNNPGNMELITTKVRIDNILSNDLNNFILPFELSLLERRLFLKQNTQDIKNSSSHEEKIIYSTYQTDLQKIPFNNLVQLLQYPFGYEGSASRGINRLICNEINRRISNHEISCESSEIKNLTQSIFLNDTDKTQMLNAIKHSQLDPKAQAFRKIYKALRDGQSDIFKTDFLDGKETLSSEAFIAEIIAYSALKPHSRTAKAWSLTQTHYHNLLNTQLFTEIYNWSFDKSGLFKSSNITGTFYMSSASLFSAQANKLYTSRQIMTSAQNEDGRTAKICRALRS